LALKGNQGILKEDVELYFQDAKENDFKTAQFDYHKTLEKDHGRIEIREYWATDKSKGGAPYGTVVNFLCYLLYR
jgi:hypothetical protein